MTGAEAMVRLLQAHGVKHIFGLCGDTSLPFYDALYRLDHGMQHILGIVTLIGNNHKGPHRHPFRLLRLHFPIR